MARSQSNLSVTAIPQVCREKPALLVMTGVFRCWMTYHFGNPSNIVDANLKQFVWDPDPAKTQISIEAAAAYEPRLTEFRPGVILKRQDWSHMRLGIGNRLMGANVPDGAERYMNAWQGAHTIFCIGHPEGQVELLAAEVYQDLNEFAPIVRRSLDLARLEVAEIGKCAKLDEESGKNFVVPINIAYVLSETWQIQQDAPFLNSLDWALDLTSGHQFDGG